MIQIVVLFASLHFASGETMAGSAGETANTGEKIFKAPVCFEFSSDNPVSRRRIMQLASRHNGQVLIGLDPGNPWESEGVENFERITAEAHVQRHIYLEGPGGPTGEGDEPDPDELKRMRYGAFKAAKKLGVSISQSDWRKKWREGLWLEYTKMQILDFQKRGYSTFEIDNLDSFSGIGAGRNPEGTVRFFKNLSDWMKSQNVTMSLVAKNLSPAQIRAVAAAKLDPKFLAPFAISEEGYDKERAEATKELQKLHVTLLRSGNTRKYGVSTKSKPGCE